MLLSGVMRVRYRRVSSLMLCSSLGVKNISEDPNRDPQSRPEYIVFTPLVGGSYHLWSILPSVPQYVDSQFF